MEDNKRLRLDDGSGKTRLKDGTKVGKYTVKFLTTGGMSVVYHGTCKGKEYVLKEVETSNTVDVPSLLSEKSLLERLDHPGIVDYVELFNEDGYYYLVVEYVKGEPLSAWIDTDRLATFDEVVDWGGQLAEVFSYLHSRQPTIIYRDLKPANVLLTEGEIKLIDFGIARLHKGHRHKDTALFGSALTASPEHYGRSETDARSDIYTLGMTLYLLLTGGKKVKSSAFELVQVKELREDVPEELNAVITKSIELEPEDRYQTMLEFREALYKALGISVPPLKKESTEGLTQSQTQAFKEETKTSYLPLAMAAFLVCLLTLGFVFGPGAAQADNGKTPAVAAEGEQPQDPDMEKKLAMTKKAEMEKAAAMKKGSEDPHAGHNHAPGEGHEDEDPHAGHNHAPGEHGNPYGGTAGGLAALNIPGDIFGAGKVDGSNVVMLGEDVGLFEVTSWEKESADERAGTLSERLNSFYHQFCPICGQSKLEPGDIKVGRHIPTNDIVVFFAHTHDDGKTFAGPLLLATVTDEQATDAGIAPRFLASFWRDLLRDTIQLSRGLGSHHTALGQDLEEALIRARDQIRLGDVSTGNLKQVLREVTGKEAFRLRTTFRKVPDSPPAADKFKPYTDYEPLAL